MSGAMITLLVLGIAVAGLAILISIQPNEFRVTREASFAAPPAKLFPYFNNLQRWQEWSPWAKMDPAAQTAFEGPVEGAGARLSWDGDVKKIGTGSMTIKESVPEQKVVYILAFKKPMEGTNQAEITLTPEGAGTRVAWTMYGPNSFMGKAIGLVMDCKKIVSDQFDSGFANLRALVEGR